MFENVLVVSKIKNKTIFTTTHSELSTNIKSKDAYSSQEVHSPFLTGKCQHSAHLQRKKQTWFCAKATMIVSLVRTHN